MIFMRHRPTGRLWVASSESATEDIVADHNLWEVEDELEVASQTPHGVLGWTSREHGSTRFPGPSPFDY